MSEEIYDFSWDKDNEELWDRKYEEWEERDWLHWLTNRLVFPFSVGHVMKAMSIENEDDDYGIIVKVKEEKKIGYIPLCDLEVTSREDSNFWPVREYVVWFANC
jgi:hypothetical protein